MTNQEDNTPKKKASSSDVKTANLEDAQEGPLTLDQLDKDLRDRIHVIRHEFIRGLNFVRKHKNRVTFYGSARFDEDNPHYQKAVRVARRVAEEGIDIVTGGGPGIMEAANKGASEAKGDDSGHSLGLNIELPAEQTLNSYTEEYEEFHYFFVRKVALAFSAEAYIFFPGGFGTLDEFLEILTLVQTEKIVQVPIILVGSDFWDPFEDFVENILLNKFETISEADIDLYHITDDEDEVVNMVSEAELRDE